MPVVPTNSRILVTGANGYISLWVVRALLKRGFVVRGTVRTEQKANDVKGFFEEFGDKLELVVVPDMTLPGAFDMFVKDVQGIAHLASPVTSETIPDPEELIRPAVQGTLSLLESVKSFGKEVKRIVVTGSVMAVLDSSRGFHHYAAADWNETALKAVREQGFDASPVDKYAASKLLAERALWDFVKTNKDEIGFEVSTVLPAVTIGPYVDPKSTTRSMRLFTSLVKTPGEPGTLRRPVTTFVDVRDVAEIHLRSLTHPYGSGHRFFAAPYISSRQEIYDAIHSLPDLKDVDVPIGTPGAGLDSDIPNSFDVAKTEEMLGFTFTPFAQTIVDTVVSMKKLGFV